MKMFAYVTIALAGVLLLSSAPARGESCVTSACHADIAKIAQPHAPVKDGDCGSCHTPTSKEHPIKGGKSFVLAEKGGALCTGCHDGLAKMKVVHPPVKDGECLTCHKPAHGGSGRFLLEKGDDLNPLCTGCHDGAPFQQRYMHGPAAVGSCTECHDPHQSQEKKLLKQNVRELCLKCHADFHSALKGASFQHPPVKTGPCTACHDPHGSANPMFLVKKMPELCIGCHKGVGKKIAEAKVIHQPIKSAAGCSSCHSSHFSKARGLLALDEMETCLSCHGSDKSSSLHNIRKEIAKKKNLHGPLKKGECKGCHDPHGSNSYRMLPGSYPDTLYAPYKDGLYDGCLKCHDKNLLRFPDTTIYTKFRNGNKNLHFLHVVNSRKGRTCRVCHAPHASDGDKLMHVDGVAFGDWKVPVNFKMTDAGGSCAPGCHRPLTYDREKPQDYSIK